MALFQRGIVNNFRCQSSSPALSSFQYQTEFAEQFSVLPAICDFLLVFSSAGEFYFYVINRIEDFFSRRYVVRFREDCSSPINIFFYGTR